MYLYILPFNNYVYAIKSKLLRYFIYSVYDYSNTVTEKSNIYLQLYIYMCLMAFSVFFISFYKYFSSRWMILWGINLRAKMAQSHSQQKFLLEAV